MTLGVFVHRHDSIYEDIPGERHQFPGQYFGRARAFVGSWVLYYEPRKVVATRGYFAVAKVDRIVEDPTTPGMHIAFIEPCSYLEFSAPVAFADENGLLERGLLNEAGRISGRAQAAIRPISPADFDRIVALGLGEHQSMLPRIDDADAADGFAEQEQAPFIFEEERRRVTLLTSRTIRDRVFRRNVLRAYGERCAVSGLKLINGGGRAEVAAAHIRPVEANGPDIVSNGIALSGTAHWMFDRGLIGLSDNLDILISRHANDPDGIRAFINRSGRASAPADTRERPHPHFLNWHRENCFKR